VNDGIGIGGRSDPELPAARLNKHITNPILLI
jgi:hypothetical protein